VVPAGGARQPLYAMRDSAPVASARWGGNWHPDSVATANTRSVLENKIGEQY
jgi:hypothetical protein